MRTQNVSGCRGLTSFLWENNEECPDTAIGTDMSDTELRIEWNNE